jgi:hypothetical protein
LAARQSERRELTPPQRPDLRDILRASLDETDRLAAQRRLAASFFRFGELEIAVRVLGPDPLQRLLAMIAARAAGSAHDGVLLDVIGGPVQGLEGLLPAPEQRGRMVLRSNEDLYYLWLDEAGGYLTAIDRRSSRGLVWFTKPDRIASWHIARPLMHAIKGASLHTSWTPVHAASVACNGGAILIVGQSGAGKTSIAMACAAQGWNYLGDDAVIVRAGPPRVASLYSSARLREDTFQRYPDAMRACLGVSDDAGELKAEVDMALLRPPAAEAEIKAIVVPQPTDWSEFRLAPLGRADTLRKLMAATRQSMLGDDAAAFAKLAALVSEVPCYALTATGDAAALSGGLARLVDGAGAQ